MKKPRQIFIQALAGLVLSVMVIFLPVLVRPVSAQSLPPEEECRQILREVVSRAGIPGKEKSCTEISGYTIYSACSLCIEEYYKEGNPAADGYSNFEQAFFQIFPNPSAEILSARKSDPIRQSMNFYGHPALLSQNESTYTFEWLDTDRKLQFSFLRFGFEVRANEFIDRHYDMQAVAETFYAVASENLPGTGVEPPLPEAKPSENQPLAPPELESAPVNPPQNLPQPLDLPDSETENNTDSFALPEEIIVGSLAIPVIGAFLGAAASVIASLLAVGGSTAAGAAQSAAAPATIVQDGKELYWSERPWDEAGPGFVTREEYEQTQRMLAQGYRWTKDGWRSPDEIRQNLEWEKNNRLAVEVEDAELRAQQQAEIERGRGELARQAEELNQLQPQANLYDFRKELEAINQSLLDQNIHVANPLQGDPTLILDGITKMGLMAWDNTAGWITNAQGMTCGDYVGETLGKVKQVVQERFGEQAKAEGIVFEEKSTRNPQNILDWFDKLNDDNHNLIKVTLPDGSEWAVDFHQHNDFVNRKPLMRPWEEVRKEWKDYLGDEFMERVSVL